MVLAARAPYRARDMKASLWLFLPTYNEAGNIEGIVRATLPELERAAPGDWGLLVVDDASPDVTGAVAYRLAEENDRVEVLHRAGKEGLGKAHPARLSPPPQHGAQPVG